MRISSASLQLQPAGPAGESWLTVSAAAGHRALSGGGRHRIYRSVDWSKLPNFWKISYRGARGAGTARVSIRSLFPGLFFFAGDCDEVRSGRSAGDPGRVRPAGGAVRRQVVKVAAYCCIHAGVGALVCPKLDGFGCNFKFLLQKL